jgi:hypothetical protein
MSFLHAEASALRSVTAAATSFLGMALLWDVTAPVKLSSQATRRWPCALSVPLPSRPHSSALSLPLLSMSTASLLREFALQHIGSGKDIDDEYDDQK